MTLTTRVNSCGVIVGCWEKVTLYDDGHRNKAEIRLAQHEGVWRYGIDVTLGYSGWSFAPTIHDDPGFLTRLEAIEDAKRYIRGLLGRGVRRFNKGAEPIFAACQQRSLF